MAVMTLFACGMNGGAVAKSSSVTSPNVSAPAPAPASIATLRPTELATRLKQGGHLIVMRHERTQIKSREDDYSKPLSDCLSQRNLSVAGFAGASETGEAIRVAGLPIAQVYASPMCRTMETARAAFGRAIPEVRLAHPDPAAPRAMLKGREDTLTLANSLQMGPSNVVFVTHQPNLFAFDLRLGEGETAALKKDASGKWILVGRATGSEWNGVARGVLATPTPPPTIPAR